MNKSEPGFRFIGQPMVRHEDARLVAGKGQFSDDFSFPGQTYAAIVRSPHPHARIVSIDKSVAQAMPGVLGIYTGDDCLTDGLGSIPHDPLPKTRYDMKLTGPGGAEIFIGPHLLLPADKVRHVGEAVAMVVAETRAQALDAAEAVVVAYEELPFVIYSEDGMKAGAPAVWDEVPSNILVDTNFVSRWSRARRWRITIRRPAVIRSTLAAAVRSARSARSLKCSASSPTACAFCPSTSAAILALGIASM
jgi:carbon-monoxide dehydrogenase large subunit